MAFILLDGIKAAKGIKSKLKGQKLKIKPCLAIIQVGNDERSALYIKNKKAFATSVGAEVRHIHIDGKVSQNDMEKIIHDLNNDKGVHGIIVQLPIPAHLDKESLLRMVYSKKDVDGLSSDTPVHTPATARGVMTLLNYYNIEVKGKKVVVIGKSKLVGGPTACVLSNAGAEVETCDKQTKDIPEITRKADIIVVAAGSPHLITKDYVGEGQVIVDIGINPVTGEGDVVSHTVGDVNFSEVSPLVRAISPVPGGVGPLTVASLFENLFDAFQM
jgi:methylenetetrahydrofolate dehydrogenase (NADP+) / methenyltetrahydrofolate cyclohydrolase